MARAKAITDNWDAKSLAGQVLMTGIGNESCLSAGVKAMLEDIKPGAILLFRYNIAEQLSDLFDLCQEAGIASIQEELLPFIALDHEGGRVNRFKNALTRLPSAATIGRAGAAALAGSIAGSELHGLGISMNLAPVAEAAVADSNTFLGDRAFSSDWQEAACMTYGYIKSCQMEGTLAVAKHFPASGNLDPHSGPISVIGGDIHAEQLLAPFAAAIKAEVSAILLSHVVAEFLDPLLPVSISPSAIAALKEGMGFGGIVMSDDLEMAALSNIDGSEVSCVTAIKAGVDLIMTSSIKNAIAARDAIYKEAIVNPDFLERLRDAAARIVAQKLRFGLDKHKPDIAKKRLLGLKALVEQNEASLNAMLEQAAFRVKSSLNK
ncbi:hypothetical protein MASR2M29_09150 [Spirochaetota bacterium]